MKKLLLSICLLASGVLFAQYQTPPNSAANCPFCPNPDQTDVYAIPLDEDANEVQLELDEFNGPRSNNRDSSISK